MMHHVQSYYAATANAHAPWPQESIQCDVCIIGGGFTGLSSALFLPKPVTMWWCWKRPTSASAPAAATAARW
ncbi:hypothetical protein E05_49410 [Plautia stali symbiont]|nr:hypothetical protein E05_49410 [Plautia stali symbiont]